MAGQDGFACDSHAACSQTRHWMPRSLPKTALPHRKSLQNRRCLPFCSGKRLLGSFLFCKSVTACHMRPENTQLRCRNAAGDTAEDSAGIADGTALQAGRHRHFRHCRRPWHVRFEATRYEFPELSGACPLQQRIPFALPCCIRRDRMPHAPSASLTRRTSRRGRGAPWRA